jgi:hypothetical protein
MNALSSLRRINADQDRGRRQCILMFSGGRDSTLAAVRLVKDGFDPILITITSGHLFGLQAVHRRHVELKAILPSTTRWMVVRQPTELRTDTSFYERTCLPCHHAYVVVAAAAAMAFGAEHLSFGYAGYQNDWPEQTPFAVERLAAVLADRGVALVLPVYDLPSRDAAEAELARWGLSSVSLEQKCIRQISNVTLPEHALRAQIQLWEDAIRESTASLHLIDSAIEATGTLGEVST